MTNFKTYGLMKEFAEQCPDIFKRSCVVGVFDGNHFTRALVEVKDQLEVLDLYDDLRDIPLEKRDVYRTMWKEWGVEVKEEDGADKLNGDYTFIKTEINATPYHDDYHSPVNPWIGFENTIVALNGFGSSIYSTIKMCEWIKESRIFPIWKYRDYLYFATTQEKKDEVWDYVIDNIKIPIVIKKYKGGDYIDLFSWYASKIEELKEQESDD